MYKITNISWHGSTIEAELSPRRLFANHYCNSKLEITFGKLFVQEDYLKTENPRIKMMADNNFQLYQDGKITEEVYLSNVIFLDKLIGSDL